MGYALVGTIGAVSVGSSGAAVTPAWGASESRTAGNLLILQVAGDGSTTLPAAPAGWSIAKQIAGGSNTSSIFYKIAAGSDAAPTVAAISSDVLSCRLAEFSGNASSSPLDQTGSAIATSTPQTPTTGGVDAALGELVIVTGNARYTLAATKTLSNTLNNGATSNNVNNNSTSTISHYDMCWGITTGNSAADASTFAFTTSHITAVAVVIASFKLPATPVVVTPGVLALSLSEFAPTVATPVLVTPGVLALTLTEFAPSVTATNNQTVTPGTLALSLSEFAPSVKTPRVVVPGALALSLSEFAPTVKVGVKVVPSTLALSLSEFAPTVKTPRLVTPGVLALSLSAFAPAIKIGISVKPATLALSLTAFEPTVVASANQEVIPGVLALTLTKFAPVVATPRLVVPGVKALSLSTFAPTVTETTNVTVSPGTLALLLAGYGPTVTGQVLLPDPAPPVYVGDGGGAMPSKRGALVTFAPAQQQHQVQPVKVTRVPEWLLSAYLHGDVDEEEFTVLLALN